MEQLAATLTAALAKVTTTQKALQVAEAEVVQLAKAHQAATHDATEAYVAVQNFVKNIVPGATSAPRSL